MKIEFKDLAETSKKILESRVKETGVNHTFNRENSSIFVDNENVGNYIKEEINKLKSPTAKTKVVETFGKKSFIIENKSVIVESGTKVKLYKDSVSRKLVGILEDANNMIVFKSNLDEENQGLGVLNFKEENDNIESVETVISMEVVDDDKNVQVTLEQNGEEQKVLSDKEAKEILYNLAKENIVPEVDEDGNVKYTANFEVMTSKEEIKDKDKEEDEENIEEDLDDEITEIDLNEDFGEDIPVEDLNLVADLSDTVKLEDKVILLQPIVIKELKKETEEEDYDDDEDEEEIDEDEEHLEEKRTELKENFLKRKKVARKLKESLLRKRLREEI